MPRINFCFQGWVNDTEITSAMNPETGLAEDVSGLSAAELIAKLEKGELCFSFVTALSLENCRDREIELSDYSPA